ncbi:Aspartic ase yapsin-6 [Fusarium agapanthi]|uniref:Aspartic ase yapsin-6 n=1 Tax=Fusarium agapanthi TaxID=1803897 RepID=A0A9P5BCM9_9HYPO|nr:Aspartic ase yapsin-6 [Fusarium agapanthi]
MADGCKELDPENDIVFFATVVWKSAHVHRPVLRADGVDRTERETKNAIRGELSLDNGGGLHGMLVGYDGACLDGVGVNDAADFVAKCIDGDLITVPMVDPFNMELSDGQTNSVNVTSVEVFLTKGNNRTKETYGKKNVGVPVLMDSGTASWYLTHKTMPSIRRAFNAKVQPFGQQYFVVDCKYADTKRNGGYIAVEFGVHGTI